MKLPVNCFIGLTVVLNEGVFNLPTLEKTFHCSYEHVSHLMHIALRGVHQPLEQKMFTDTNTAVEWLQLLGQHHTR